MPQLVSYLLPPGSTDNGGTGKVSPRFFNILLKLSNQQLLELIKSYSGDQKSVKLVVKNNRIESIKIGDRTASKFSNLRESRIDLYASLKQEGDFESKCVSIGNIDRRLNPLEPKPRATEQFSDIERLSLKFKVIEKLALLGDRSIGLSDLTTLFRDEDPTYLRTIYDEIISNRRLKDECLLGIRNSTPSKGLNRLLDSLGYDRFNPFRLMISNDAHSIPLPIRKAENPKSTVGESEDVVRAVKNKKEATVVDKINPITVLPSKKTIKSRPATPQLVASPQLRPLPKARKKKPEPKLRHNQARSSTKPERRYSSNESVSKAPREQKRVSHDRISAHSASSSRKSSLDASDDKDRIHDQDVESDEGSHSRPALHQRKRAFSEDNSTCSSSASSTSNSARRSNKSSPLSSYYESDDDANGIDYENDCKRRRLVTLNMSPSKLSALVTDGLHEKTPSSSAPVKDDGGVRQMILRFQDTYRRYYKLYESLDRASHEKHTAKEIEEINERVRTLVELQNDLQAWKRKLEAQP